jgi:Protein of unknown function (DUF3987)
LTGTAGQGGERAFWIEAFGGRGHTIDRVKFAGAPIMVPFLSICVEGGVQPDRLGPIFKGEDDGLAARFLWVWPEPVGPKRPSRMPDDDPACAAFRRLFSLEVREPSPVVMSLDDAAADAFQAWRVRHAASEREASGIFLSWLGKQPGYLLRIALVLELLDWSVRPELAVPARISASAVSRAIHLTDDYLKPMAERVFGDAALPQPERNAAMVARLIFAKRLGCESAGAVIVNARELQRAKLPGLRTADAVGAALDHLVDAAWLSPMSRRAGGSPGRQRLDYLVNPALWKDPRQLGEEETL